MIKSHNLVRIPLKPRLQEPPHYNPEAVMDKCKSNPIKINFLLMMISYKKLEI
jgi:hypothetical protein